MADEPDPEWRQYEAQISRHLRRKAVGASVELDASRVGRLSGAPRQIDVLVEGVFPGLDAPQLMVVDCKHLKRNVHVKDVEAFGGMIEDIGATFGVLISSRGFSNAAVRRAAAYRGISLEVVAFDRLAQWTPRRPTVAWTAGTNTATITWYEGGQKLRTDLVSVPEARTLAPEVFGDSFEAS